MFGDQSAYPVCGAINGGVQIGIDVLDDGHSRINQIDLDVAELVGAAARSVLVAQAYDNALDAAAMAGQPKPQTAFGVIGQRVCNGKAQSLNVEVHVCLSDRQMQRQR